MIPTRYVRMASQGASATSGGSGASPGGDSILCKINVGTTAGSSSVVIYDHAGGGTSTTSSSVVSKVDTSNASGRVFDFESLLIPGGFTAYMLGGNSDVTISYR